MLKSGVVYKIVCPSCTACYVGETARHLQFRFKEHIQKPGPMRSHLSQCNTTLSEKDIDILQSSSRGETYLLTLEALHQRELKPTINTKEEYRSRELKILLQSSLLTSNLSLSSRCRLQQQLFSFKSSTCISLITITQQCYFVCFR